MKDLLLLPFYLTAFFSNSLQISSSEAKEKINQPKKFEIKIDLQKFIDNHFTVAERVEQEAFDKEAFKEELLRNSRKK
ncbi:MAG: hypothetical protein ACOCXH_13795 [Cyclobacteriaceae bacterium]